MPTCAVVREESLRTSCVADLEICFWIEQDVNAKKNEETKANVLQLKIDRIEN
jgi:hypothetical protein